MNDLVSNLKIGGKLGQGHFGEVFEGQDDVHGTVAVKLIRKDHPTPESLPDWDQRKADLLGEAKRLEKAKHPNVVEVYHLVARQDGNTVIYVMEYCAGGCLQSAYEAGPMPIPDVRRICTEVAIGLGAMHARGMLHRDIKPSNILKDANGVSRLGDFGLVTDRLILGYGSVKGYADHVAPEVWNGNPTSAKSDIWALGKWLPHIPKRWKRAVRHMLRDDPSDRCPTAQAVQNALAGLPIPDWTITYRPDLVRWVRERNKRRVVVEWHRQKKHSWSAWSEPLGVGKKHTLVH